MNFASRLLGEIQEVDALTFEQFSKWDRAKQEQYLRDHPDSDFAKPESERRKNKVHEMDDDKGRAPRDESEVYPVPQAPTTYMVLSKALGQLDKKTTQMIQQMLDTQYDKELIGIAENNLRSLTRAQLQYVISTLSQGLPAPKELEPETQTLLNSLKEQFWVKQT